ncbi:MAG: hypothetical protein GT589_03595 [Peptoclostridium sp.]|uniref:hypothetical protein n=1 Tax=Peptoclostridium sp. TaxID=1904860 RepID=UPI00139B0DBB|nr:hypothetical protein [Peptoclostridium sp.]MZQ75224.1 hypothetical protein [Peptoclostridium sp.]
MDTIKRQDAAAIIMNRFIKLTLDMSIGENSIAEILARTQSDILTDLLLYMPSEKVLSEFDEARDIWHIVDGIVESVESCNTEDGEDLLTIAIRKDDQSYTIAFKDGEWLSNHISEEN